jgi:hypothetical protein
MPWIFDCANDPKELWNIAAANTWVGVPVAKIGMAYQQSQQVHPNIAPGMDGPPSKQQNK